MRVPSTSRGALVLLRTAAATVACVLALLAASGAQAATVTVGSPLMLGFFGSEEGGPATLANTSLSEPGANVTSPINGAVILWRMTGTNSSGGPFRLVVLRPAGGGKYAAVGSSASETLVGTSTHVFSTSLPIQSGDLIGLDTTNLHDKVGLASTSSAGRFSIWSPQLLEGDPPSAPFGSSPKSELGFNAEVQPPPGISSVSPASDPTAGGASVAITGHDFTGASAVKFGSTPASSFTVNSEALITAIAPPSATAGTVSVSATTAAGTTAASPAAQFTYTAVVPATANCTVPKLKGKNLEAARKKLTKAHCKLGKVKGKATKNAKVKKQSAKVGAVLAVGAKVNVKLG